MGLLTASTDRRDLLTAVFERISQLSIRITEGTIYLKFLNPTPRLYGFAFTRQESGEILTLKEISVGPSVDKLFFSTQLGEQLNLGSADNLLTLNGFYIGTQNGETVYIKQFELDKTYEGPYIYTQESPEILVKKYRYLIDQIGLFDINGQRLYDEYGQPLYGSDDYFWGVQGVVLAQQNPDELALQSVNRENSLNGLVFSTQNGEIVYLDTYFGNVVVNKIRIGVGLFPVAPTDAINILKLEIAPGLYGFLLRTQNGPSILARQIEIVPDISGIQLITQNGIALNLTSFEKLAGLSGFVMNQQNNSSLLSSNVTAFPEVGKILFSPQNPDELIVKLLNQLINVSGGSFVQQGNDPFNLGGGDFNYVLNGFLLNTQIGPDLILSFLNQNSSLYGFVMTQQYNDLLNLRQLARMPSLYGFTLTQEAAAAAVAWILVNGFWNDDYIWIDSDIWIDGS